MRRLCDSCGTPLPGKGHGMPVSGKIVCGRKEVTKSVRDKNGSLSLRPIKTPACSW